MQVLERMRLADWTTLGLGGEAARVAVVEREEDVPAGLAMAAASGVEPFVLGGGSNVVVADEGFGGVVLRMGMKGCSVDADADGAMFALSAGESWGAFVDRAVDEGYAGVECLAGIPGLVGATPIQNVGAYGQEVRETIVLVRLYDRTEAAVRVYSNTECAFGYRTSLFKGSSRFVVTRVGFKLRRSTVSAPIRYAELAAALGVQVGETAPLAVVRDAVLALRRSKGMVLDANDPETVSAGSFFVNPVVDEPTLRAVERRAADAGIAAPVPRFAEGEGRWKVPAAWLIERAGFAKGYASGRAAISKRHALALVNHGGTTAGFLALARRIRQGVLDRFGVTLTAEPVLLGCSL